MTGRAPHARRWALRLGALVVVGAVVRAAYVLVVLRHVPPGLDAVWYTLQGGSIRRGTGYVVPTSLFRPPARATAGFPPLYPTYQALWQTVFGEGARSVRLAGMVPGAVTIVVVGWLGRRMLGPRAGLVAAAVVAFDPVLIAVDGSSMSENLSVPLVAIVVLLALTVTRDRLASGRSADRRGPAAIGTAAGAEDGGPGPRAGGGPARMDGKVPPASPHDAARPVRPRAATVAALGAVVGLAVLTRQDLVLLVPVVVALGFVAGGQRWRRRVALAGLGLAAVAVLVVPWSVRNHRQVGTYATSTLSASSALAGANCDRTYGGRSIGIWEFSCVEAAQDPGLGEAQQAARYQRVAVDYAKDHVSRLPLVAAAREARVWGFWSPNDQVRREAEESRRVGWQRVAWPWRILLVLSGVAGLVGLVHRDRSAWPLLVPLAVVATSAVVGQGNPRFSAIAHPVLAVGLAALLHALWSTAEPKLLARFRWMP